MRTVNQRLNKSLRASVALILSLAVLASFATFAGPGAHSQEIQTRAQFLHAGPGVGKVEVHVNNNEVLDEFTYGTTSKWIDIDPGIARVTITQDRAGFNWVIMDSAYPITAGNDYNFIISDVLTMSSEITRAPLAAGMARAQIVHASVDTPAVDVAVVGTDKMVQGLQYSRRSAEVDVPAGTYDLEVRQAGTTTVLATVPGVNLEAGKVYELVLMGEPGSDDKPITITPLVDDVMPGTPAASPEASPAS
jgi:uncharacterized protein DUF4397